MLKIIEVICFCGRYRHLSGGELRADGVRAAAGQRADPERRAPPLLPRHAVPGPGDPRLGRVPGGVRHARFDIPLRREGTTKHLKYPASPNVCADAMRPSQGHSPGEFRNFGNWVGLGVGGAAGQITPFSHLSFVWGAITRISPAPSCTTRCLPPASASAKPLASRSGCCSPGVAAPPRLGFRLLFLQIVSVAMVSNGRKAHIVSLHHFIHPWVDILSFQVSWPIHPQALLLSKANGLKVF